MTFSSLAVLLCAAPTLVLGDIETFDRFAVGSPPPDWVCGVTGHGSPKWTITADPDAPSAPNVLIQSGSGTFPWCVKQKTSLSDGSIEVRFKTLSGREDKAGGVVWRWKDGDNYYVARANALENNVSLYYTEDGSRKTIKYVNAPVAANQWHTLKVAFAGKHIQVYLDGDRYIDLDDNHIAGVGAVGVWTKADSVTAFDNFSYNPLGK